MAELIQLTQFRYSAPVKGELMKLYIYGKDGKHSGRQFFRTPTLHDGEITVAMAFVLAMAAVGEGREVRVTNGGDELLFRMVVDDRGHVCEAYPHDKGLLTFFGSLT